MTAPRSPFVRMRRLAHQRSARAVAETARRVAARELECRRIERGLARAARRGERVIVGPFLGEVGFELLYWVPMVRRLLAAHGVSRESVVVLTRGGAASWYSDFAADKLEILDLVPPTAFGPLLAARRAAAGSAKQVTVEELDRRLIAAARAQTGAVAVVHPILMFTRLRWVWHGAEPADTVHRWAEYRRLEGSTRLGEDIEAELPVDFVALKAYFSDCFPHTAENVRFVERLVDELAQEHEVVVLGARHGVDDHEEWAGERRPRVHPVGRLLDPRDNLAVQTEVVRRSRGLVATYGGFSYLGPLLAVPTTAFRSRPPARPEHLDVLRAAFPDAAFEVAEAQDAETVAATIGGPAGVAGAAP